MVLYEVQVLFSNRKKCMGLIGQIFIIGFVSGVVLTLLVGGLGIIAGLENWKKKD